MTLYDLYLDQDVSGYIVFKTLSKKKVMEIIQHRYKGPIDIQESDLYQLGDCLVLQIKDYEFKEYLQLYRRIMLMSDISSRIENEMFNLSFNVSFSQMLYVRIDVAIIGKTKLCQPFIIRSYVRDGNQGLDIYFERGESYFYVNQDIYRIEENLYQKYIKKYNIHE